MLYKFDILFKKELRGGGVKVVTYRQLLQDADAFGQGEALDGAVGTLSLTDSVRESGYSISSLFVKYRNQLVGYYWAEVFGKEFPLLFSFNQMDDAASIHAELVDENNFHYSSHVEAFIVEGIYTLDLSGQDTFVALVPMTDPCSVADAESELTLQPGQLVLVPASCKGLTLHSHCLLKNIKFLNK